MVENELIDQAGLMEAFSAAQSGQTQVTPEPEITPDPTPEATPTPEPEIQQQPDYWQAISEKTGGFIKDEDTLTQFTTKAKGYDDLETKLKDLETKVPTFKNPETETLYKLWAEGDKDAVVNYIRESTKDYKSMSDLEIVREQLSKKNPTWSSKDVELEIRSVYGKQLEMVDLDAIDREENPDEYKEALQHNERVEENLIRLQRAGRDARIELIEQQSKIELPKLHKEEPQPQQQEQMSAEEYAQKEAAWKKSVDDNIGQLNSIKQTIDDREVEYSYSEDELKSFGEKMKSFNIVNYAKERGWINDKGETDFIKLGRDVQWIEDREKIAKSFATQIKTDTTKDVIKKIKNIDDPKTTVTPEGEAQSMAEAYEQARRAAGWS